MGAKVNSPTADDVFDNRRTANSTGLTDAVKNPVAILAVAGSVGFELVGKIDVVGDAFVFVRLAGDRHRSFCQHQQFLFCAVHWPELGMKPGNEENFAA